MHRNILVQSGAIDKLLGAERARAAAVTDYQVFSPPS